jgi:hypothetical protein
MVKIAALINNQTAKVAPWNCIVIDVLDLIRTNHPIFFHHFVFDGADSHILKFWNYEPIRKHHKLDKKVAPGEFAALFVDF